MDGDVDLAIQHRRVDFFCEQPFAASLGERAILNHVSAGADDDNLEASLVPTGGLGQQASRLMGLREREG